MMVSSSNQIFKPLQVPDRFESLLAKDKSSWGHFISPVQSSLAALNRLCENTTLSSRGQLFVLESKPGYGKTTFLNTSSLFLPNIFVHSVPPYQDADEVLMQDAAQHQDQPYRLYILEGRESIDHVTEAQLGQLLHQINQRLRSPVYSNAIVAWPCNSSKLASRITGLATQIGGAALLDNEVGHHHFKGPDKKDFRQIASSTISFLNDGADLVDVGIDEFTFTDFLNKSACIGDVFTKILSEVSKRRMELTKLQNIERHRLWVVVAAGSQPEKDVGGLTRGSFGACDINRLCNSTRANIVAEVKEYPEKLGLLAGYFDAKITFVSTVTLLAVVRAFADANLLEKLKSGGTRVAIADPADAIKRLQESQLATLLGNKEIGLLSSASPVGSDTKKAFTVLTGLASSNDTPLNEAFAKGLVAAGLINSYKLEQDFGQGLTRRTDILADTNAGPLRLEMMWRKETSKADMANYTLTKLFHYGRALGLLKR